MKRIIVITGVLLLFANIAICNIISLRELNMMGGNLAILLHILILLAVNVVKLKDAFKVSLNAIFAFCGLTTYLLSVSAPSCIEDNFLIIYAIIVVLLEIISFVIVYTVSNRIKL